MMIATIHTRGVRCAATLALMLMVGVGLRAVAQEHALKTGDVMPTLRGEYLTGRAAALPEDCKGKVALLVLGFTYPSRYSVEPWTKRFRASYGGRDGVTFYEIPVVGGAAVMGKWFINSGMRKGTPVADREHVITVYGGTAAWKHRVGYAARDAAYLILLDANGRVAWTYAGDVNDAAYQSLAATMEKALAGK